MRTATFGSDRPAEPQSPEGGSAGLKCCGPSRNASMARKGQDMDIHAFYSVVGVPYTDTGNTIDIRM
jgi:hypothetical protein